MKGNLFLLVAAAVVMAGCSKTETVEMPDSAIIGFGNAYIGNPTQSRAVSTLTTDNINAFYVYGGHEPTRSTERKCPNREVHGVILPYATGMPARHITSLRMRPKYPPARERSVWMQPTDA